MPIFHPQADGKPNLYALPPGRPFFDDLVAALLADAEGSPERLADIRVFVPSRRAARSLRESFARAAKGQVVILPRIIALAELSEDDAVLETLEARADPLPEAPPPAVKRLKLAHILRSAHEGGELAWDVALRGAEQLMRTSDQLIHAGITAKHLAELSSSEALAEHAQHWDEVLKTLRVASEAWPAWLADEGLIDARQKRARILESLTQSLRGHQASSLTLAAGFLGTSPTSLAFLRELALLPSGAVIIPGLDRDMTEDEWQKIEAPHPQSAYHALLDDGFDGLPRSAVKALPVLDDRQEARRQLISLALMPTEATHGWYHRFTDFHKRPGAVEALEGLELAIAETPEEEADFIALKLRSVLETPDETAFLVTADRILARRVASKLKGWGIEIDDSGGSPLAGSYRATFFRLIARLISEPSDVEALAGLIHHQLFAMGKEPSVRLPLVQKVDQFLRGRPPRPGWDGLLASLGDSWRPGTRGWSDEDRETVRSFITELRDSFEAPVRSAAAEHRGLLSAHLEIAERLVARPGDNPAQRLFRFEDGEALESHLNALQARPELLPDADEQSYADVFDALLQGGPAVRPPGGQHPRLSIFGVLEARLQTADHVVVGGLQEGVWPGDEVVDPFLSRAMRKALGLPSPDADIGRVAHDFAEFASMPKVMLTRAERTTEGPVRPSRFMVRLESLLEKIDPSSAYNVTALFRNWRAARFTAPGQPVPAKRPLPTPPSSLRPRRLSISQVGTWHRDPYAIYADKVLGLRPLQPYQQGFLPQHRGEVLHALFEDVIRSQMENSALETEELIAMVEPDVLDRYDVPGTQRLLNRLYLDRAVEAFLTFNEEARERGEPLAVEVRGSAALQAGGGDVTIHGRADRIDQTSEGPHIIDYKSSGSATMAEDRTFSSQLFLSALMMRQGGFEGVSAAEPEQISFVTLSSQYKSVFKPSRGKKRFLAGSELTDELNSFEEKFGQWLDQQFQEETPFAPQLMPFRLGDIGDYDDLSRRLEWSGGGDD